MAGMGEVTLGSSRHLPAHGIARRASSREHGASQAEEKRPIWAFLASQARRGGFARAEPGSGGWPGNQT